MAQTANININVNSKQAQDNVNKLSSSINGASQISANLKTELRQITKELQNLEPGSARFNELSARAGQLRDTIQDTNAVINATAGNVTENFGRALSNTIQIGVAGFQSLMALQSLFGSENEELNKTLVKFSALLNLSQAIETFGGLGDKITEIKAGFMGLVSATQAQTVAQTAENVATAEGVVATTALGTAMKALPIIAIAAAIGTLVYGLYQYISASDKADKAQKQRQATLKAQREEEQKARETIAGESAEFVLLITRLKQTNKNSKERKDLIKQINGEYGTTLKNLSDEKKFQEQLNVEVANYIAYQKAKYQLQKNEKLVQANLVKQDEINQKIVKTQKELKNLQNIKLLPDDLRAGKIQMDIRDASNALAQYKAELVAAELRLMSYGKVESNVSAIIAEVTDNGKKYGDQTDKNTESTKDANEENEKYAELLAKIKDEITRQVQAEEELEKAKASRIKNVEEREVKLLEQQYGEERQKIIDGAIQREIEAFDEKFKKEGKSQEDYDKGIAAIKAKADGNLLDSEKVLLEQKKTYLDQDIQNIREKYDLQEEITINATKAIQDQTLLLDLEFQKEQEIREINNGVMTEEKKQEAILEVKKKYADKEIELIKQSAVSQREALRLAKDQQLSNEELTAEQRKEIEEKYNQDVLKLNQDTQTKIQEVIDGTKDTQESALEGLNKTIDKISQYVDKIAEIWGQVGDIISQRNEQRFEAQSKQIDNLYDKEKEALDEQLENQLITREQYDNKVKELDQQRAEEEKQLALKKFNEQKKLQLVNATIQGAQAVLAAYSSGAAVPIIGPATTGPIYAAIAAAFAAVQIAAIANQQFSAAEGGIVPGMGPGYIDSVPSMLAPGEFVINSRSAQMYPELLSSINERGGGKKLVPDLPPSNAQGAPSAVFQQDRVQQPIKAYVVETDISDSQKRVNRIKRSVEF
jgi:hypothetical protein